MVISFHARRQRHNDACRRRDPADAGDAATSDRCVRLTTSTRRPACIRPDARRASDCSIPLTGDLRVGNGCLETHAHATHLSGRRVAARSQTPRTLPQRSGCVVQESWVQRTFKTLRESRRPIPPPTAASASPLGDGDALAIGQLDAASSATPGPPRTSVCCLVGYAVFVGRQPYSRLLRHGSL